MPVLLSGDEVDAVAFDGAGDDGLRPALGGLGAIQSREHRGYVVSVDYFCSKTLRLEFLFINFHIVLIHGGLALAQGVDVGKHRQVVQLVVAGEFGGFPDLSFGHFAVAEQNIGTGGLFVHALGDRQTRANRKSLAQGASGGVDAGNARRGMAFEFARKLTKRHQPRFGKDASFGEGGIEHGGGVAL